MLSCSLCRRLPPTTTRTDTRLPYTTRFLSGRQCRVLESVDAADPGVQALLAHGARAEVVAAQSASAFAQGRSLRVASAAARGRSEEHTSETQSLMRISYAVFCLTKTQVYRD